MAMTEQEVVALISSSQNEQEWNNNYDRIRKEGGGRYWWEAVMMSGLAHKIQQGWLSTAVKGNLPKIDNDGPVQVIELGPPTPEEIAEIRQQQALGMRR